MKTSPTQETRMDAFNAWQARNGHRITELDAHGNETIPDRTRTAAAAAQAAVLLREIANDYDAYGHLSVEENEAADEAAVLLATGTIRFTMIEGLYAWLGGLRLPADLRAHLIDEAGLRHG